MDQKDYLYDLLVHDLRSPLAVMAATTKGLLAKPDRYGPLTVGQEEGLQRIARNIKRAQGLLEEILDLGRSEQHLFHKDSFFFEGIIRESLVNVMEFVDADVTERLKGLDNLMTQRQVLADIGISVEISGRYEKAPFCHDRRKVQLILENLISNAMKYRKKSIRISILGEHNATILVSDDGSGIPLEEQASVYGRFVQLENAACAPVHGLGLGLYCVKALLDTMGGEIALTSKEGSGTTFTVQISPLQDN